MAKKQNPEQRLDYLTKIEELRWIPANGLAHVVIKDQATLQRALADQPENILVGRTLKREEEWGGGLPGFTRIIAALKDNVSRDYGVGYQCNSCNDIRAGPPIIRKAENPLALEYACASCNVPMYRLRI
jgi:hypothetical protein